MTQFTDDLLLLEELRRSGSLTPDEFTLAKAKLLTGNADAGAVETQIQLAAETHTKLRRLELQNEHLRVEQEWDNTKETLMIHGKYGSRFVPTQGFAIAIVVLGVAITIFFAVMEAPDNFGFSIFVASFIMAGYTYFKATQYTATESDYHYRKSKIEKQIVALEPDRRQNR